MRKHIRKWMSILMAICLLCSVSTLTAFAEAAEKNPVVIGEFDGLLSDYLTSNAPVPVAAANVRINSYATYDENNGIQVKVKLYVPWFEFPKPEFTSMSGTVTVDLNGASDSTSFFEIANGDETIESDVDTGVTGNSGDSGTVSVSGIATANNALLGGGAFGISYGITIP